MRSTRKLECIPLHNSSGPVDSPESSLVTTFNTQSCTKQKRGQQAPLHIRSRTLLVQNQAHCYCFFTSSTRNTLPPWRCT